MKRVVSLSEIEIKTLSEAVAHHPKHRSRARAHALLLSNKKFPIKQLATIFDVSEITVSNWIDAWYEQGISSLFDDKRSGRPTIFSQQEAVLLKSFVDEEPHQLKRAQSLIQDSTGKACSLGTVKRTIKKNLITAIKE